MSIYRREWKMVPLYSFQPRRPSCCRLKSKRPTTLLTSLLPILAFPSAFALPSDASELSAQQLVTGTKCAVPFPSYCVEVGVCIRCSTSLRELLACIKWLSGRLNSWGDSVGITLVLRAVARWYQNVVRMGLCRVVWSKRL
jgi:hypothetical protein